MIETEIKTVDNPLEELFGVEPNSTPSQLQVAINRQSEEQLPAVQDEDHKTADEIDAEQKLETIFGHAMAAFEMQTDLTQTIDPKFAARNAEVAAQYLNIALAATNSKINSNHNRRKLNVAKKQGFIPFAHINNNTVVADRNEILRSVFGGQSDSGVVTEE